MKTVIKILFLLVLFLFPPVNFSQERDTNEHEWEFLSINASAFIQEEIKTIGYDGFRIFRSRAYTKKNGGWYTLSHWKKNTETEMADVFHLIVNFTNGENVKEVRFSIGAQNSDLWFSGYVKTIELIEEWQEITIDMREIKKDMLDITKLYLNILLISEDSCRIGGDFGITVFEGKNDDGSIIIYDSFETTTGIDNFEIPTGLNLFQNYPNPFNPTTTIKFNLPEASNVVLKVYNTLGQEIASLIDQEMSAGQHEVQFNGYNLPSGVYFYHLSGKNISLKNKMMLIK